MALSAKNRAEIVDLIGREVDFERSGISGRIVRDATACPRQGELTKAEYQALMSEIAANLVRYVVFSYTTPIAWVGRDDEVTLVERKFTATTSQHQKMVREAYGEDRFDTRSSQPKGEAEVQLSENEEIILRRMRDESGTEFSMVSGSAYNMGRLQKTAPRDQLEPLGFKGLVEFKSPGIATLTDKGRKHLDKIQPVVSQEVRVSQYLELSVDELIDLASQMADEGSDNLVDVVKALKARNDITRPARWRVGEYLRQTALIAEREMKSALRSKGETAKIQSNDQIETVRGDKWAAKSTLRRSDLAMLAPATSWDSEGKFREVQQERLAKILETQKLSEKQTAYVQAIAAGAIHEYGSYTGGYKVQGGEWNEKLQHRADGRTLDALKRRGLIFSVTNLGWNEGGTLALKDPEKKSE